MTRVELIFEPITKVRSKEFKKFDNNLDNDVAKISTNKLSTLVFDFTFISLHLSTLRQGPLQVILHFKLIQNNLETCNIKPCHYEPHTPTQNITENSAKTDECKQFLSAHNFCHFS